MLYLLDVHVGALLGSNGYACFMMDISFSICLLDMLVCLLHMLVCYTSSSVCWRINQHSLVAWLLYMLDILYAGINYGENELDGEGNEEGSEEGRQHRQGNLGCIPY